MDSMGQSGNTRVAELQGATGCAWIGMDVAKLKFDAALLLPHEATPQGQQRAATRVFERSPAGVRSCLAWVQEGLARAGQEGVMLRAVLEATGKYSEELAQWVRQEKAQIAPAIVNAAQAAAFARSLHLRNSTDPVSARMLALYGHQRIPRAHVPLVPERAQLRELCRYRAALVNEQTAASNRLEQGSSCKQVARMMQAHLNGLRSKVARLDKEIAAHIAKHASLCVDHALLCSIPGVGPVTATVVLAELGDLRDFQRRNALSAHAGISPRRVQSGSSVHRQTRMSKQGNAPVRGVLYMAALTASTRNPSLAQFYKKLIANGKPKKAALGAVMRKLLLMMRAVLINETPYDPAYKYVPKKQAQTVENFGTKRGELSQRP